MADKSDKSDVDIGSTSTALRFLPEPRKNAPTSLPEALAALRADEVLVEALGKDFLEWYTLVKDAELADVAANTARFAATGMDHDAAVQEAWNSLYFEFV